MENNDNTPDVVESEDNVEEPAESTPETVDINEFNELKNKFSELEKQNEELSEKLKNKRIAQRKANQEADSPKTDKLDYAQKAFLNSEGIKEFDFVEEKLKESGYDLERLLNNKYFQQELKDHREAKAVKDATPSGTRSDSKPARTKVDYWIEKGELPPNLPENQQLRREVVNERERRENTRNQFTQNPIVSN